MGLFKARAQPTIHNSSLNGTPFHLITKDITITYIRTYFFDLLYPYRDSELEVLRPLLLEHLITNCPLHVKTKGLPFFRRRYLVRLPEICNICFQPDHHSPRTCTSKTIWISDRQVWDDDELEWTVNSILKYNRPVERIRVGNSRIGEKGGRAIARLIAESHSLTQVYLHENDIDEQGVLAIAEAVRHTRSVARLNINNSHFKEAAITCLANGVRYNKSLIHLDINETMPLPDRNLWQFSEALRHNTYLRDVRFVCQYRVENTFDPLVRQNRRFTTLPVKGAVTLLNAARILLMGLRHPALKDFPTEIWLTIFDHYGRRACLGLDSVQVDRVVRFASTTVTLRKAVVRRTFLVWTFDLTDYTTRLSQIY